METIKITSINDDIEDFRVLFDLCNSINNPSCSEIRFDFSECKFLAHNAVAFLGGLANLISHKSGSSVKFDWGTLRDPIRMNLAQNGFLHAFGSPSQAWAGNSIPYRADMKSDPNDIIDYLKSKWLGRGWGNVHISKRLRDAIVGRVWEIYANAFEHASSEIGIYSCGQYYPNKHELSLSVVDFGIGIPNNVRNFKGQEISTEDALQWAFQRGTTTKPNSTGRGVGLDLLQEFVRLNNGLLQIFSNDGFVKITKDGKYFSNFNLFDGTFVNITLSCNESLYIFSGEDVSGPIF